MIARFVHRNRIVACITEGTEKRPYVTASEKSVPATRPILNPGGGANRVEAKTNANAHPLYGIRVPGGS